MMEDFFDDLDLKPAEDCKDLITDTLLGKKQMGNLESVRFIESPQSELKTKKKPYYEKFRPKSNF